MYNYQFVWKQKHNHAKHYIETHSLYNENMAMHAPVNTNRKRKVTYHVKIRK